MRWWLMVVVALCAAAAPAWAKTLKIPIGAIQVNQLHDELLAQFPEWRGTQRPDGVFTNPPLRVEFTPQEITLTVPDDADERAIQVVVAAHQPRPRSPAAATVAANDPATLSLLEARVSRLENKLAEVIPTR